MHLILVRHGETQWNIEGKFQGQNAVGLSQQGMVQAWRLANALRPMGPVALYTSPLTRSSMTAEVISQELSVTIKPHEGLKELNLGEMEGIVDSEMRTQYPDIYATWREDPSRVEFPAGESLQLLQDRAWGAVEDIEKSHPQEPVVAVSHNFAIRAILHRFLGLPLSRFHLLRVDLASISVIRTNAGLGQVLTINERCHLSENGSFGG